MLKQRVRNSCVTVEFKNMTNSKNMGITTIVIAKKHPKRSRNGNEILVEVHLGRRIIERENGGGYVGVLCKSKSVHCTIKAIFQCLIGASNGFKA